jgi:hypothetical protein
MMTACNTQSRWTDESDNPMRQTDPDPGARVSDQGAR